MSVGMEVAEGRSGVPAAVIIVPAQLLRGDVSRLLERIHQFSTAMHAKHAAIRGKNYRGLRDWRAEEREEYERLVRRLKETREQLNN